MTEAFDLTCEVAVDLLPEYLDDALPEGMLVRFEQHIVACPGCRTYLTQLRRTIDAVAGLRGDRYRGQVWEGIAAGLAGEGGHGTESAQAGELVAYKFLSSDRMSPFAHVLWPEPGRGWVRASAAVGLCRRAVHACYTRDLAYWLDQSLWRVELAGQIVAGPSKIAADRGRLLDQVDGWPKAGAAFVGYCVDRIAQLRDLAKKREDSRAVLYLTAYATEVAKDRDPASVSYTAAHAAGVVGWTPEEASAEEARGVKSPFDAERRRQSRWLANQLGLPDDSTA
jgi:hypothetical protein